MSFILQDSSSNLWNVTISDIGVLDTASVGSGSPNTINLNSTGSLSWLLGVTTVGTLETTSVTFNSGYATLLTMASATGLTSWSIGVLPTGALFTTPAVAAFGDDSFSIVPCSGFDQNVSVF
jgi:hypothetical protein